MKEYNNESIKALTDREAIRTRIGNYTNTDGLDGSFHLVRETVNNAIDEYKMNNKYNKVYLTYHKDNSLTIQDFARGIPVDYNESEQVYNYYLIFEKLNAGGKFDNESYKYSTGLNGQGNTILAMSSEFAQIEVNRDGYQYNLLYKKGILQDKMGKTKLEDKTKTGTKIHWKSDLEVFTDVDIPVEMIKNYLQKQAIINKGIYIYFNDEHTDLSECYYYEEGIKTYLENESDEHNISEVQYWDIDTKGKDREDKDEYECTFQLSFMFNKIKSNLEYYHNSAVLKYGGSPAEAIKTAFVYAINKFITDNKLYNKNESKIKFEDVEENLFIISNTYSTYSVYMGQTKTALTNKFINVAMTNWIKEQLEVYFIENKDTALKIANQVLINRRAREKSEITKLDLKKKLSVGTTKGLTPKIQGVKHCNFKKSTLEERIFIVDEGLSANSTIEESIDGRIMGCCGLRGRFINSLKGSIDDVLKNEPALRIIKALGCGVEVPYEDRKKYKSVDSFDINNLQYGAVGILCDADAFGKGISLSLIAFFYRYMKPLLQQNRIFLVKSPRYEITTKDEVFFVYNEDEKNQKIQELQMKKISYSIGIKKGLGEFNKDDFHKYVLSDEARKKTFIPVEYIPDEEEAIKYYFDMLMGDNIADRKKFINENIVNVNLDELD